MSFMTMLAEEEMVYSHAGLGNFPLSSGLGFGQLWSLDWGWRSPQGQRLRWPFLQRGYPRCSWGSCLSLYGLCYENEEVLVAQLCPTLCDPMDRSPPGSSLHVVFQARTLEWAAMPTARGSSRPRDWTWVSCIAGRLLLNWTTREALFDLTK